MRPLLVLVTGDPVAAAFALRGSYADMIRSTTADAWTGAWSSCDLRTADALPEPETLAGVIITGSAAHVHQREPWIERGLTYLQRLVRQSVPTLGICFGHQMLGEALGGRVGPNPAGREIGSVQLRNVLDNPLLSASPPCMASATHLDSVLELPPGALTYAATELEANALVQFGPKAWGVQFHPEMDAATVRCYIEERRPALQREGLDSERIVAQLDAGLAGRAVLPNFVQRVVLGQT